LGRFISKDAFSGSLSDPYSQHDYQYAHANPVRFTDPTGYFTMGDIMATLNAVGALAAIGGVGFGGAYIAGAAAGGASGEEILGMFGDWGAGFASGVSGGYLTDLYEVHSGNKFEATNGALWGAGNVTGIGVSFLLGMKLPVMAATKVGPLQWVAAAGMAAQTGLDIYGAAKATGNLYQSYQDNGRWELQDTWNLLAYVPFVGMTLGVAKGISAARKVKTGKPSVNEGLTATGNTKSFTAGGGPQCFVAGTEILTTEGIKNIEDIRVGDWVIADDPTTPGGIVARQVLETFISETDALYDLYVDGEIISATGEHPFWTADKGWVEAADLIVGSLLQTADGRIVDVDRVEKRFGKFEVYNFNVEGIPTYFVSDLGILVHNVCDPNRKPAPFLPDDPYSPESVANRQREGQDYYGNVFDPQAVAKELGYTTRIPAQKAPFDSHGQTVFSNGKNYISRDIDSHNVTNGWKMFNKKGERIGTYSSDLTTRLKD
jgi:hypothetical protein